MTKHRTDPVVASAAAFDRRLAAIGRGLASVLGLGPPRQRQGHRQGSLLLTRLRGVRPL